MTVERNTSAEIVQFMLRLSAYIKPLFPSYANALSGEIVGKKMTNERWNRVAAILASMSAIPGKCLIADEHIVRNPALSAVVVAQQMAMATFGGGKVRPEEREDCALYCARGIEEMISLNENKR